jgi:uncharacterized membrane protein
MKTKLEQHKKLIFTGIIIIALGITFTTTMQESMGTVGTVFIAIGGLFFIFGMKKKEDIRKAHEHVNPNIEE